ncbi:MAG TPA: hypothetical protein VFX49_13400 [Chloroflexota bacterium]|nr:hypothetical protein [Chloroflexota bacterium]
MDAWAGALLLFLIMAAVCVPAGIAAGGVFALLLRAVPPGVRGGGVRRPSRTIRHFAST